jgi:hypothetical protein
MALVYRFFPKKDAENALRAEYHARDTGARAVVGPTAPAQAMA